MTVTNAAATVDRNSETGPKSPTLDFGLDSIFLLKTQGKFSVMKVASASSFRGWLESSPCEGELWLRNRARDGDVYAIEQRYPSRDPITAIVTWVHELSEMGVLGVRFTEPWLLMLRCLLMKCTDGEILKTFAAQYGTQHIPNIESYLAQLWSGLQDSWVLQPVLQN